MSNDAFLYHGFISYTLQSSSLFYHSLDLPPLFYLAHKICHKPFYNLHLVYIYPASRNSCFLIWLIVVREGNHAHLVSRIVVCIISCYHAYSLEILFIFIVGIVLSIPVVYLMLDLLMSYRSAYVFAIIMKIVSCMILLCDNHSNLWFLCSIIMVIVILILLLSFKGEYQLTMKD